MTVTEGIYEIGDPDENSPVLVTTNFALTYFIVSGEIEGSKVPDLAADQGFRRPCPSLTAWAAGKFAGDDVGMFVKKCGIMDKVKHTEAGYSRVCGRHCRRCRRGTPGLDDYRRAQRSRPYPGFSQIKIIAVK